MALFELSWQGGTSAQMFRRSRPGVDDLPWDTLDAAAFPDQLVADARRAWTVSAHQEYCAAAAFSELTHAMLRARAPVDLVGMAGAFVADEMSHVELNARVAMTLGGAPPLEVDFETLAPETAPDLTPLQRANELIIRTCCVGETFSLPALTGTYTVAHQPLIREILRRISQEEAPHGRLGWLYLDWVAEALDPEEKARLADVALDALLAFAPLWREPGPAPVDGVTAEGWRVEDVHALGWMTKDQYAANASSAVRNRILRPLAAHGIVVDAEARETLGL